MQTVVVFNKKTRDVLIALPLKDGETGIVQDDVDFAIFNGVEPVFVETPAGPKLKENSFILLPGGGVDA